MKSFRNIFIIPMVLLLSCSDNKEPGGNPGGGDNGPLEFAFTGDNVDADNKMYIHSEDLEQFVEITTNYRTWSAYVKTDSDWIKIFDRKEPESDRLKIITGENVELASRTAEIEFRLGKETRILTITQFGYGPEIIPGTDSFDFNYLENSFDVTVAANVAYEVLIAEQDQSWIEEVIIPGSRAVPMVSKTHRFKLALNPDRAPRVAELLFRFDEESSGSVVVSQEAIPVIEFADPVSAVKYVSFESQDIGIVVATNREELEVDISAAWLTLKSWSVTDQDAELPEHTYIFTVSEEPGTSDRQATVTFSSLGIEDELTVEQTQQVTYHTKIGIVGGSTDNDIGSTFVRSYDSDFTTHYDSNYNLPDWVETTLMYELEASDPRFPDYMDYIVYYARYDSGNHGAFGNFDVSYSTEEEPENFILLGNYTVPQNCYNSANGYKIEFERIPRPKYVKFYIYTTSGTNYISCKEMEFYYYEKQNDPYLEITPWRQETGYESTTLNVEITSNVDYTIETSDWITRAPARFSLDPRETQTVVFNIAENPSSIGRYGHITISDGNGTMFTAYITQRGNYNLITAEANSEQPGEGINLTIDGNYTNFWHTRWSEPRFTVSEATPAIGTYTFGDSPQKISSVRYYPRNGFGRWGRFEVYVQAAGGSMELVGQGDNQFKTTGYTEVFFDTVYNPEKVQFIIPEGNSDHASCSEMEFYE